ncbi:hypothetical protein [Streptomyces sp. NPDC058657]|uniref:hypothetical protein n=1 Tax=unclassified Streptomyces TaxID=2593676 RepID=UPI00364760FE
MSQRRMSPRQETVERNLWAAPALFVLVAWVLFKRDESQASAAAWAVYAVGWLPAVVLLAKAAVTRRNPGIGAVVGCGILVVMGAVFWMNHG